MSSVPTPANEPGLPPAPGSLLERVRARVQTVHYALQRRDNIAAPPAGAAPLTHEMRALRLVYHTLGQEHRRYRQRTGQPVPPALKAAALAFKREPSLVSLVPVAGFLDDLGLLKW
jgi:hypothetical protein